MELKKVTDRVWISSFEEERDRPALGYIYGEKYRLAVDAGHSKLHVEEFYALLKEKGLPLPDFTVLTHWHWDHTFGMPWINGSSLAEERTQAHLLKILSGWGEDSRGKFMEMDEHIALEYADQDMHVVGADIVFKEEIGIDLGKIRVQCFHVESPHTEDSVLVLLPEEKILFFGDCISGKYPDWIVDRDLMKALILALQKLDFTIAIGGHWNIFKKEELLAMLKEENGLD